MAGLPNYGEVVIITFSETTPLHDNVVDFAPYVKIRRFGIQEFGASVQHPTTESIDMVFVVRHNTLRTDTTHQGNNNGVKLRARSCLSVARHRPIRKLDGLTRGSFLLASAGLTAIVTPHIVNTPRPALVIRVAVVDTSTTARATRKLFFVGLSRGRVMHRNDSKTTLGKGIIFTDLDAGAIREGILSDDLVAFVVPGEVVLLERLVICPPSAGTAHFEAVCTIDLARTAEKLRRRTGRRTVRRTQPWFLRVEH